MLMKNFQAIIMYILVIIFIQDLIKQIILIQINSFLYNKIHLFKKYMKYKKYNKIIYTYYFKRQINNYLA